MKDLIKQILREETKGELNNRARQLLDIMAAASLKNVADGDVESMRNALKDVEESGIDWNKDVVKSVKQTYNDLMLRAKQILREEKKKLFIPRKLSDDDSRYSDWNNSQPIIDGKRINQYDSDGRKQGYWEEFDEDGEYLTSKGSYVNGIPNGYWEEYWGNGKLKYKGSYINGKKDGYWESYWGNGNVYSKGNYKNGGYDGEWFYYHYDGRLEYKILYKNGNRVRSLPLTESKKLFIPRKIDEREVEFEKMVKDGTDKFLIDNDIKSLKYVVKVDELWDDLDYDDIDNAIWDNEDCEVIFNNGEKWVNSGGWRRISHSDFIDYSHTISGYLSYLMSQHNPEDWVLDDLEIEIDSVVGKIEIDGIFTTNINKKTKVVNFSKTI